MKTWLRNVVTQLCDSSARNMSYIVVNVDYSIAGLYPSLGCGTLKTPQMVQFINLLYTNRLLRNAGAPNH